MTNLEVTFLVAWIVTFACLVRIYRKHMIVRHLFIHFSDWCARKIDEMTESASWEIIDIAKASADESGRRISDDEARKWIPFVILNAKGEWEAQADYFQAMLKHNGMAPLGEFDLDALVLNPGLAGLKFVSMQQAKSRS